MNAPIEIHGFKLCPFAFRTRLAASEKGVGFDWLPADVPEPDPRSGQHNPNRRSPLLCHADFTVTDSVVIAQYIDEAFEGPPLQPRDAKPRAGMRLAMIELNGIMVDGRKDLDDEAKTRSRDALAKLDARLANGAEWLGGASPNLADLVIWPFLAILEFKGALAVEDLPRAAKYWERVQARPSFRATNPYTDNFSV